MKILSMHLLVRNISRGSRDRIIDNKIL